MPNVNSNQQQYQTPPIYRNPYQAVNRSNVNIYDVMDPATYVLNGQINWMAVNQNVTLNYYPLITENILCEQFPDLDYFIKKNAFGMFTLAQLKDKISTQPQAQPKMSTKQKTISS